MGSMESRSRLLFTVQGLFPSILKLHARPLSESQRATATGGPTPAILRRRPTLSPRQSIDTPCQAKQSQSRLFDTAR